MDSMGSFNEDLPLQNDNTFNMSSMSFLHQPNPDYGAEEVVAEAAVELEADRKSVV